MDRHIIGTFREEAAVIKEINRLINDEGYSPDELMVVIDNDHEYEEKLNSLKQVEINQIDVEESVWDKIKDSFSFGSYNKKEESETLENYGVPHERSEHYMDALKDGEIILLANSDAPAHNELSQVNNEVVDDERMTNMDKNNRPIDEVNTEEEEAIKNKESNDNQPSNVETSETDTENMTDSIDPSQVNSTRSEENTSVKNENNSAEVEEDNGNNKDSQWSDSDEEPELTGEEESVDKDETEHNYGNTIAEGVVRPEVKSPLNTEDKEEKEPSEKSETPEADAHYPDEQEEAGMKSED